MSLLLKSLKRIEAPAAEASQPVAPVAPPAPPAIAPSSPLAHAFEAMYSDFPVFSPTEAPLNSEEAVAGEPASGPVLDAICDSDATEFAADISVDYDEMTEVVPVEEIIYGLDESEDPYLARSDREAPFDGTPEVLTDCEPPTLNVAGAAESLPSSEATTSESIEADESGNSTPTPEVPDIATPELSSAQSFGDESSTLDRLNELNDLIGASLASTPETIHKSAKEDADGEEPPSIELAIEQERGSEPSFISGKSSHPETFQVADAVEHGEISAAEQFTDYAPPHRADVALANFQEAQTGTPSLAFAGEYRELCSHLLARFTFDEPRTLLWIDAGSAVGDASWLVPLAECLCQELNQAAAESTKIAKILVIEAAGAASGIASSLGLESPNGLAEILRDGADWAATVQATPHPQVDLLAAGRAPLPADYHEQLDGLWREFQECYCAILIASGPWKTVSPEGVSNRLEPLSFVSLADAAILCIEIDGTPQAAAKSTKRQLQQLGLPILGSVVRTQENLVN